MAAVCVCARSQPIIKAEGTASVIVPVPPSVAVAIIKAAGTPTAYPTASCARARSSGKPITKTEGTSRPTPAPASIVEAAWTSPAAASVVEAEVTAPLPDTSCGQPNAKAAGVAPWTARAHGQPIVGAAGTALQTAHIRDQPIVGGGDGAAAHNCALLSERPGQRQRQRRRPQPLLSSGR